MGVVGGRSFVVYIVWPMGCGLCTMVYVLWSVDPPPPNRPGKVTHELSRVCWLIRNHHSMQHMQSSKETKPCQRPNTVLSAFNKRSVSILSIVTLCANWRAKSLTSAAYTCRPRPPALLAWLSDGLARWCGGAFVSPYRVTFRRCGCVGQPKCRKGNLPPPPPPPARIELSPG